MSLALALRITAWWKPQRPVLVHRSAAPECESDPGCSAALLQSQCHGRDHLLYPPKPSGGCWHQHRPAGGVLPPASPVLSVSAERPPGFSRHQRWALDCFQPGSRSKVCCCDVCVLVSPFGGCPFRSGVVHHRGRMSSGRQPLWCHNSLHLRAHRGQIGGAHPPASPSAVPTSAG